jgi:hypothetical protein
MENAKFAYTAPAMDEVYMTANAGCSCSCSPEYGAGAG